MKKLWNFLKSTLFRQPVEEVIAVEVTGFASLLGHRVYYHNDQTGALQLDVEVRQGQGGYLEVITTRHPAAGPQSTSVLVNLEGVIANCPEFGEQYVGRQDCLWLPPALRFGGASGWVGMYPSQIRVVEQTVWRGTPVWRCEYKVFGNTCELFYEQTSGVKVGQDGVGHLARSTLGLPLPKRA